MYALTNYPSLVFPGGFKKNNVVGFFNPPPNSPTKKKAHTFFCLVPQVKGKLFIEIFKYLDICGFVCRVKTSYLSGGGGGTWAKGVTNNFYFVSKRGHAYMPSERCASRYH